MKTLREITWTYCPLTVDVSKLCFNLESICKNIFTFQEQALSTDTDIQFCCASRNRDHLQQTLSQYPLKHPAECIEINSVDLEFILAVFLCTRSFIEPVILC